MIQLTKTEDGELCVTIDGRPYGWLFIQRLAETADPIMGDGIACGAFEPLLENDLIVAVDFHADGVLTATPKLQEVYEQFRPQVDSFNAGTHRASPVDVSEILLSARKLLLSTSQMLHHLVMDTEEDARLNAKVIQSHIDCADALRVASERISKQNVEETLDEWGLNSRANQIEEADRRMTAWAESEERWTEPLPEHARLLIAGVHDAEISEMRRSIIRRQPKGPSPSRALKVAEQAKERTPEPLSPDFLEDLFQPEVHVDVARQAQEATEAAEQERKNSRGDR